MLTHWIKEIALNNIPEHSLVNVSGYNGDVDTGAVETLWPIGLAYVFLSTASTLDVVSDSADDDVGGTGALTLKITGLDADYEEIEDTVIMTGAVAVVTTKEFLRVNHVMVASAGTGLTNAGNISITNTGGAINVSYVEASKGVARVGVYTVPAGHSAVMLVGGVSYGDFAAASRAVITMKVLKSGVVYVGDTVGIATAGTSTWITDTPHVIEEKQSVFIDCDSISASNGVLVGHMHFVQMKTT